MNDPVGRPIVHLDHVTPGGLAGDGDEGSARVLGHGDLLPGPGHHGVGAGVQGRGENQAGGHMAQQCRLQHIRVREQLLRDTGISQKQDEVFWAPSVLLNMLRLKEI